VLGRGKQPSQIDGVTSDTRLVTLTGGGNDVGYVPLLFAASVPLWVPGFGAQRTLLTDPHPLDDRLDAVRATLGEIATEAHRRAPDATVVFVNYLTVLPPDSSMFREGRNRELAELARSVAARLAKATRTAAADNNCILVDAAALSLDHHAWSTDPWTTRLAFGTRRPAPLHPNAAGMRAVADAVLAALST
jgi:lysophospholipase L1-like esterase